jgi:putative transposase
LAKQVWTSICTAIESEKTSFVDTFFIHEVFDKINGKQQYLWRAVDQDGDVIDVFLQERRNSMAAKRFLKRLIASNQGRPRKIVTDKLGSYRVAHPELMPDVIHDTSQYANNKVELSHQSARVRERGMRRFKSIDQAQRFLSIHAVVHNHFNLGRGMVSESKYRNFREGAFKEWREATA